jgi:acetylornithine deacetylase
MNRPIPSLLDMISELVALPSMSSVSPAFDTGNRAVCERIAEWLEALGFEIELQPVNGGIDKVNLIATRGSGRAGLVLAGHTDTVPYDASRWNTDPFVMTESDGNLYGLGTTDMKAFLALAVEAAWRVAQSPLAAPLVILATADEESSMAGARALLASQRRLGRWALIGEPTNGLPVRAHKGILMEAIKLVGRSGHSSNPAAGRNALDGMAVLMQDLMTWREQLASEHKSPAFPVPYPTLNLGRIQGGDNPNRICPACELHIDLRTTPGLGLAEARQGLHQRLRKIATSLDLQISFQALFEGVEAMETDPGSPLVLACERLTGQAAGAVNFGTEGPFLTALGLETVIMGPGDIAVAHQPDEFIRLASLNPTLDQLGTLIRQFCMGPRTGDPAECA